jgi:hypothetical protein
MFVNLLLHLLHHPHKMLKLPRRPLLLQQKLI